MEECGEWQKTGFNDPLGNFKVSYERNRKLLCVEENKAKKWNKSN